MKRIIFAILLLPQLVYAQYRADIFSLDISDDVTQRKIGKTFCQDTTLILGEKSKISGLSISGIAVLNNDNDSYIRVTLVDEYNYEFLVYENYPVLSDNQTSVFDNIALETVLLDNVTPQCLKITMLNASLKLESVNTSTSTTNAKNPAAIQKAQTQYIVDRLNTILRKKNMTWRARVTSLSEMSYSEKKDLYGGVVPQMYGFEHYAGGVFVMPGDYLNSPSPRSSDDYVAEWDWRNRHGKNWMTDVRNQNYPKTCGSCWAHAAVGVLEAYVNLYYNRILTYDLSEEEIISCTHLGCIPANEQVAFNYIKESGIVNESCFPYAAEYRDCGLKCDSPLEQIFIEDFGEYTTSEDSMKQQLFRAPITIGLGTWHHSMTLAGYKKIAIGSSYLYNGNGGYNETINLASHGELIGRTAWLVKNSHGYQWGNNGFGYIVVDSCNINEGCYIKGRITSLTMNDDGIKCTDADGDGFYFWGIGPKPAHCPSWVPDTPDGDDSNINYGAIDSLGVLEELPAGETIKTPKTYTSNSSVDHRIGIVEGGSLTIRGTTTMEGDSHIRVCEEGTLIVDGGTLQNADITLVPGCTVIIRHNGKINMAPGKVFQAPVGVIVNIESGEIN